MKYLFALMDDETHFWILQQITEHKGTDDVRPLLREGKRIVGKTPENKWITLIQNASKEESYSMMAKALSAQRIGS